MRQFLTLPIATLMLAMSPVVTFADSGALNELTTQLESSSGASGSTFVDGGPAPTINHLTQPITQPQSAQNSPATQAGPQPPYYEQWNDLNPPNPIDTFSDRLDTTLDTNRFIDPITGRIDGVIEAVTGRVNGAINKTLDGLLSPVDKAVDGAFDKVDGYIDKTIASIMAPVDNAINDVMSSIDGWIESWIGDTVGAVIDDVTGGLLGGSSKIDVEPAYDPISPLSSIITATSFQAELEGMSAPYTEAIPFAMGSMGLPDYSKIMPTLDALAKGENGHPNARLQGLDRFSTTPETLKMSLSGEVERLASRSIAQATLSEAGQEDMKGRLDGAEKTLETIIEIGDRSQDLDVTQDVMKSLAAQLAQDSVLRAGQYEQDLRARQQAAANAVVNTEIARLLGEQNRASRADAVANATMMHDIAGRLHLPGEKPDDK